MSRRLNLWSLLLFCLGALGLGTASPLAAAGPSKSVRFERPDGAVLVGTWSQVDDQQRPAVLLLHQAQKSRAEFDFLLPELHGLGFHTLAVDLRGHGESSKPEVMDRAFFMKLFKDPNYAPPDVEAMLEWLTARSMVDPKRIAVVGGSVGANLAYAAVGGPWGVRTAVALSGNADNANLLAANIEHFTPKNVLAVAADRDGERVQHARRMVDQAGEPKRLEILEGTTAHGASMLEENSAIRQIVLDWLVEQLR